MRWFEPTNSRRQRRIPSLSSCCRNNFGRESDHSTYVVARSGKKAPMTRTPRLGPSHRRPSQQVSRARNPGGESLRPVDLGTAGRYAACLPLGGGHPAAGQEAQECSGYGRRGRPDGSVLDNVLWRSLEASEGGTRPNRNAPCEWVAAIRYVSGA
ncbi:hypothetical protein THAOC_23016 [Thalassiosira oceanica]|uniref:Uncharacterized protein n=1 Tax=Thalassiosira oceanica TaxID=159749 RepID=K0RX00_THAOC|nr:hypothetical protein THAOC_23016 [Thalassiosira oceanica]|eukprot:EJK56989.1 hypothetical protein THAOC_23016 [Thalassiosira oceanica]